VATLGVVLGDTNVDGKAGVNGTGVLGAVSIGKAGIEAFCGLHGPSEIGDSPPARKLPECGDDGDDGAVSTGLSGEAKVLLRVLKALCWAAPGC